MPSVDSLLKISLGLILFTIISTALVYAETISVNVEGTPFDFEYTATGLTIIHVEPDSGFGSLLFTVDVTDSDATLNLVLERSFLDSTFEGSDDPFIIINQFGEDLIFTETTTSQSRTLNIELPLGTVEVDVIGTSFNNSVEEPPVEEPSVEEPPVEETPVEKTPVEETPVEKTPVEETPVDDTPKTQCGPGTILKDGACVLDERCGPGTILKDGACVLDSPTKPSSSSVKGLGKDMVMGFAVAFISAGIIGVILGIVSKASKSS
ncbi:hypothetical protein NSED_07050 [Candidatus Nitrosopumilus sediminis]|uniref:Uncharacterized protein n=1 Tax=Candidatus Nitrosopumilus sediminis TaxID=1229909 RepID=K0BFV2_9ARCH|nr:hypothetical protein NSED_07050 [Candidatus Nitrosopumilus sediminis]